MKSHIIALLVISAIHAGAQSSNYVNFIRQNQQGDGVVWDMPVAPTGTSLSALTLGNGGALFQLYTVDQKSAKDYLLDQKLVGAYLPTADIKIATLDPYPKRIRTRVDQPFTVNINVAGLLTGSDFPLAASSVLLERHLGAYQPGQTALDPAAAISGTPFSRAYLSDNGASPLRFPCSSLTAADPTKAYGEEHFVIHALSDNDLTQTQIASASVQVLPVASGEIKGIKSGDRLRFETPPVELLLHDLYPRSDTYLLLFEGTQVNGTQGTLVKGFPTDGDVTVSTVIEVTELDSKITKDGTYTLALVSDTVYGRELLCETITFHVSRTLHVNAMQVNLTDGSNP